MRITIEKGFHPLIRKVMDEIQVNEPKLALHHILGIYAASLQGCQITPLTQPDHTTDTDDEFSQLTDWS